MSRWWLTLLLVLAIAMAVGAIISQWRAQRIEQRFGVVGQLYSQPAATLHYTDEGSGPALVLLHGATTNSRDFHAIAPALARHYRVIAIDRPGSGYSPYAQKAWLDPAAQAQLVAQLLRHLGIGQAVWAGHSLAGSVVMAGLLNHPAEVRGGILIAGATYPWEGGVDLIDHLPGVPVIGPLATRSVILPIGFLALDAGIVKAFAPEQPTAGYRRNSGIELYLRPAQFAATARDIRRLSQFLAGQSQRYGEISQPLLMIHGDADDIVPAWNHADRMILLRPDATYHSIAGGGHQPHHVHADRVVAWIDRFMQQLPPAQDN